MTRELAVRLTRDELDKFPILKEWKVRLTTDVSRPFLGLCSYRDKCIILNAHHIDIHPDPEVLNTIRHEIAHALCPFQGHNEIWTEKAKEIGCDNTIPCSHLSFTPEIIDAIRSGAQVEVTFEEEIIRRPKYQITRLQDKCPECGKIAIELRSSLIISKEEDKPDQKYIFLECGHLIIRSIPKGTPFHKLINGGDETCAHDWIKNLCKKCGAFRPYQFQIDGMQFGEAALAVNKGVAFFDEMGLGKTIQALGLIKFNKDLWPVLYVVKSGIKFQWFKQILNWTNNEHVCQIIQSSNDILIPGLKGYIVGYDMLVPKSRKSKNGKTIHQGFDINKLIGVVKCMILDECQQIKNPDSTRTQQVRRIAKDIKVIALSGTPWKNRGSEFFSVLNMMAPMKFPSFAGYKRAWVRTYYNGNREAEGGISNPERFKEFIKDIAIRRERTEVMKELPLVNRTKLYIEMNDTEGNIYDEEVDSFVKWYNEAIIGGEELNSMNILAKMSKMRHLVGLAKIPATIEFIEDFIEETDRKLVIFVHHKDVGVNIYDELKTKFGNEFPVLKLTADMSGEDRFKTQELFNNSPKAILVGSTLASGEGINLQTCADCIMHERQWNPANEEQAEGRFIRIGQTATSVNATYVEATGSIDEHFGGIVEKKRKEFHATMNKGQMDTWSQNDIVKELAEIIVRKHMDKRRKKAS